MTFFSKPLHSPTVYYILFIIIHEKYRWLLFLQFLPSILRIPKQKLILIAFIKVPYKGF